MIGKILQESVIHFRNGGKYDNCKHQENSIEGTLFEIAYLSEELNNIYDEHIESAKQRVFPASGIGVEANFQKKFEMENDATSLTA